MAELAPHVCRWGTSRRRPRRRRVFQQYFKKKEKKKPKLKYAAVLEKIPIQRTLHNNITAQADAATQSQWMPQPAVSSQFRVGLQGDR
jgi:hypothetical protein